MKKISPLFVLLFSLFSWSETAVFSIEGMHCGGCKKIVTKKICENTDLSQTFDSCEITALDTKKQIGTLTIQVKKNNSLDIQKIEKLLTEAGDYKVTKQPSSSNKK